MAVLEAYEPIERRWQQRLTGLDVAVDEIPRIAPKDPDSVQWPAEVVADGDRDIATHLIRPQMLRAGYPLSAVTAALCNRWQPGVNLLPATDDRCETHVVIGDPENPANAARFISRSGGYAIARTSRPMRSSQSVRNRRYPGPGCDRNHRSVGCGAAGAVQSGREHRRDPGGSRNSGRAADRTRQGDRPVPVIGGKPLRGMADECLSVIGVETSAEAVGAHYGARSAPDSSTAG